MSKKQQRIHKSKNVYREIRNSKKIQKNDRNTKETASAKGNARNKNGKQSHKYKNCIKCERNTKEQQKLKSSQVKAKTKACIETKVKSKKDPGTLHSVTVRKTSTKHMQVITPITQFKNPKKH